MGNRHRPHDRVGRVHLEPTLLDGMLEERLMLRLNMKLAWFGKVLARLSGPRIVTPC